MEKAATIRQVNMISALSQKLGMRNSEEGIVYAIGEAPDRLTHDKAEMIIATLKADVDRLRNI